MPTDRPTIQVRIHELRQLFNTIDPSPFRERDLDPNCEEFILAWARRRRLFREGRLALAIGLCALEVLLYGVWPVTRERRLLERLAAAEVELSTPVEGSPPLPATA